MEKRRERVDVQPKSPDYHSLIEGYARTVTASEFHRSPRTSPTWQSRLAVLAVAFQVALGFGWYSGIVKINLSYYEVDEKLSLPVKSNGLHECRPSLPPLLPKSSSHSYKHHEYIKNAARSLDHYLSHRAAQGDIDSLTMAVVTQDDIAFQKGYGIRRANETHSHPLDTSVDENTIYRIASISKMFTTLEMMILKEKGVLTLDDRVAKFIPNFTHFGGSWKNYLETNSSSASPLRSHSDGQSSITLRQLASHLSGIGRDYPPFNLDNWPPTANSDVTLDTYHVPSKEEILASVAKLPLIGERYAFPVYSNTGFNVLGYTIVAADNSTSSFADLLHRDIFQPLGLSSSFNVTAENVDRVAVPSINPVEADIDLTDSYNPAGGQFSSLKDLITVMQSVFLHQGQATGASRHPNLISRETVAEWLRTVLFSFDDDNLSELGMPWEIMKLRDSHGTVRKFYAKSGSLTGYHSLFAMNPTSSFGVILLLTGLYGDTTQLVREAIERFQSAFDQIQTEQARDAYEGEWVSPDGKSRAVMEVRGGSLWMTKLAVNGTEIFANSYATSQGAFGADTRSRAPGTPRFSLWWTGREDEFRVAFGVPGLNGDPNWGCMPYWVVFDPLYSRGAPVDLVLFESAGKERRMRIPSMDLTMARALKPGKSG